ncbi:uracil-DNA glycosylase family protein [Halovivax gelatinilyticus]|uniref:uracil-DNA glycosylase family protein n=1 Tax=Halovivax gelatinilyticus TaxID=2961597 RepID=UPI0020CA861D|nr:uracil-DNA glycosylase family protein [Halovivax gelatinilyticus]
MKTITDRTSNPFGMRAPFDVSDEGDEPAVYGYGDPNGDFHVIGDNPRIHGGTKTGVPFTASKAGDRIQTLLRETGFLSGPASAPTVDNCFLSYIHLCTPPRDRSPTADEYAELERFFDAELRAVNAHVLLAVGDRPIDHVLRSYTTLRDRVSLDSEALHARELRGRGFLVVPLADPATWDDTAFEKAESTLRAIAERDYRQTKGVATTVG